MVPAVSAHTRKRNGRGETVEWMLFLCLYFLSVVHSDTCECFCYTANFVWVPFRRRPRIEGRFLVYWVGLVLEIV